MSQRGHNLKGKDRGCSKEAGSPGLAAKGAARWLALGREGVTVTLSEAEVGVCRCVPARAGMWHLGRGGGREGTRCC